MPDYPLTAPAVIEPLIQQHMSRPGTTGGSAATIITAARTTRLQLIVR